MSLTFIYPPTLDWTFFFQRPQQLACALASRGHKFYFAQKTQEPGVAPTPTDVPGVWLVHDWEQFLQEPLWQDAILFTSWAKYHTLAGRARLTVFDSLDAFPDWAEYEKAMVKKADLVVCTSELLQKSTQARRKDEVPLVPNGCSPGVWAVKNAMFPEVADLPRPRVLFSGFAGSWVDTDLFTAVAEKLPEMSFIIAGEAGALRDTRLPNVHRIAMVEFARLPHLFGQCDVGVIPFNVDDPVAQGADPIKLYEYLAAGLPVVSTDIAEVRRHESVRVAKSVGGFVKAIRAALKDSAAKKASYKKAVLAHTWDNRAKSIETHVLDRLQITALVESVSA